MARVCLELPDVYVEAARRLARETGVSLEEALAALVREGLLRLLYSRWSGGGSGCGRRRSTRRGAAA